MKSFLFRQALMVLAISLAALSARAQTATARPPGQISYQGFLTDANGIPLATNTPKNYTLNFRLWNASTSGTLLWGEQQVVTVDRGYFTVMLGNGSSISGAPWTNDITGYFNAADASSRYVGTTVTDLSAAEIVPRLKLLATPYSLLSAYATTASNVTGANVITSNNLASSIGVWSVAGNDVFRGSGNVGIGVNKPIATLDMGTNYTTGALKLALLNPGNNSTYGFGMESSGMTFWANGSERMRLNASGYLGIGTQSPSAPIDLGNTFGERISLWGGGKTGFGMQNNLMQLHVDAPGSDFAFGWGTSASFNEVMRIKGNGSVGVGTSSPSATLHIVSSGNLNTILESPAPTGTWADLRNTGGGTNWNFISTGTGNGEGAGKLIIASGPAPNSTGGAENMVLAPNGFTGFGTPNPETVVDIKGGNNGQLVLHNPGTVSDWYLSADTDGSLFFYNGASECYAYFSYYGVLTQNSDQRIKKNIEPIGNVLDKVLKMRAVSYHMNVQKDSEPRSIGFIAQEVEPLFPELVSDSHGKKGIAYGQMVTVAIGAIQDLNQKVEAKSEEVNALKAQLSALEAEQKELKNLVQKLAEKK